MLSVDRLSSFYGAVQVVKDVSFSVAAGEIVGLMGRNGAGKTSVLKTIMGLIRARSGSVRIGSEEMTGLAAHLVPLRGIAYVAQGRRLFTEMTVEENLRMGLLARNSSRKTLERVLNLLPVLRERLSQKSGSLSGGEQQMLAVARALCLEPQVLLLDEPSEGLVPAITNRILDTIAGLKQQGVAVLLVEQQVKSALRICERIMLMENGSIQHQARASELAADPVPLERYIGVHR
jgi:branched-chain amino acid transport system ATP-binding protein